MEDGIAESGKMRDTAYARLGVSGREEIRLLLKKDEEVSVKIKRAKQLSAPVREGQTAGYVRYYLGDTLIREYPVTVQNKVEKIDLDWCAKKVLERVWL